MKERKVRSIVMLLSIMLSTILLFVSFSIGSSYESAQRKMAKGIAGSATISISAKDTNNYIDISSIPDSPSIQAYAGILKQKALYHEEGYYESIDMIASDLSQLNQINKPRLVSGKEISGFTGKQIILPDRFTSKYGIKKGDTITIQVNGKDESFTVYDIAAYDTVFLRHTRGATALVPKDTLSSILQAKEGYSEILLQPSKDTTTEALYQELSNALLDEQYSISQIVNDTQIQADARQKSMPFFLISFFSLTMSVFIIYSSYKVITLERLPIIGTFRSIGATQKTVRRIFLFESFCYGSIGGILGIPAGCAALYVILHGMGTSLTQGIEIPIIISPIGVILSLCVAIFVSLLSAFLPIRQTCRIPIKHIILCIAEEKQHSNKRTFIISAILIIVSIILPKVTTGKTLYMTGGFSLLALLIATIMMIPTITNFTSKLLEIIYEKIFKNEGKLTARNMRGNKNIMQNITLLFISISAIISISVVGNFVHSYIVDVFQGAKLQGFANGAMNQQFIQQVKDMDGIEKVLPVYVMNHEVQSKNLLFSHVEATDNIEDYSAMFALQYTQEDMLKTATSAFKKERVILLNEDTIKKSTYKVGDTISLSSNTNDYTYTITGTFKSRATDVEAILPSNWANSDFNATTYELLAYTAKDPDAIMIQIRNLFGETENWSRTVEEFNTDASTTVETFLKPMHSMTYFILLLAVVGIMNNLIINYIQKRRSIAMYKSIGLSHKQHTKMILIEGFTVGILGAFIAICVSYLEIQTIFIVAGPKISILPELDYMTFITSGLMGICITMIGSIVPIYKSRKMKLVEELKFE